MKHVTLLPALLATVLAVGCGGSDLMGPTENEALAPSELLVTAGMTDQPSACWGQASAVFAMMGEMGAHASQQAQPRAGLANLARLLYDEGVIEAPTLQALGEWLVSIDPDLTVEACM